VKLYATAIDWTGRRVGLLTVVSFLRRSRRGNWWRCKCACGNDNYEATSGDLNTGRITSCGCYRNSQEFADTKVIHGQRRQRKGKTSRAYSAWQDMKKRCDNPRAQSYRWYGGKGISYDPSWSIFSNFYACLGDCPPGHELDRLDPNKNYEPGNCRWLEESEHARRPKPRA
jgi:hypothetical protein